MFQKKKWVEVPKHWCPIEQQRDCETGAVLLEVDNVASSLLASSRNEERAAPTDLFFILKS